MSGSKSLPFDMNTAYRSQYLTASRFKLSYSLFGRGQLSLQVPNMEFDFNVRLLMYLYLLTKHHVEIKIMIPYHSVQMSTQSRIRL